MLQCYYHQLYANSFFFFVSKVHLKCKSRFMNMRYAVFIIHFSKISRACPRGFLGQTIYIYIPYKIHPEPHDTHLIYQSKHRKQKPLAFRRPPYPRTPPVRLRYTHMYIQNSCTHNNRRSLR